MKHKHLGFTIVELLIVIVVIGILAAISIVSYTGIQDRANDTIIRDGAEKLTSAYKLYIAETGNNPFSLACGGNDGGNGWIQYTNDSNYIGSTCIDLLSQKGYINQDFTSTIPKLGNIAHDKVYMLEKCSNSGIAALTYVVKNSTAAETSNFKSIANRCNGTDTLSYTTYGMNSAIAIEF